MVAFLFCKKIYVARIRIYSVECLCGSAEGRFVLKKIEMEGVGKHES